MAEGMATDRDHPTTPPLPPLEIDCCFPPSRSWCASMVFHMVELALEYIDAQKIFGSVCSGRQRLYIFTWGAAPACASSGALLAHQTLVSRFVQPANSTLLHSVLFDPFWNQEHILCILDRTRVKLAITCFVVREFSTHGTGQLYMLHFGRLSFLSSYLVRV